MAKFGSKGNDVYIAGTAGATNVIFKRNVISTDHPADSGTETARIDTSGNLGLNTISPSTFNDAGTGGVNFVIGATGAGRGVLTFASEQTSGADEPLGIINFVDSDTTNASTRGARILGMRGSDANSAWIRFDTANSGNPLEQMRITESGFVRISASSVTGTTNRMQVSDAIGVSAANSAGFRTTDGEACLYVGVMTTGRSINARGTVNASGTDYAEYMIKDGNFTIAKGDICGVAANGKLTNTFVDAISFVVKTTNPSIVGGDNWVDEDLLGKQPSKDDAAVYEEWNEKYEKARETVDRIAFAGQVPVNVTGATPGQYIVPVEDNGGISGIAKDKSDLTLDEYMRSVGKVIAIEDDGRARIIVKVA